MKLLGKKNVAARAFPFGGLDEPLVQIRIGPLLFLANIDEAVALAREIITAVDEVREKIGAHDGR